MEYYLMPAGEADGDAVSRQGVRDLLARHNLPVLRTETESPAGGPVFWRLVLDEQGTQLQFQERDGRLTFATLEHYMASDPTLVDRTCLALESIGWQVDDENVG